jgi:hypothetical protein
MTLDHIHNIKNLLNQYNKGIEYVDFRDLYEKEYGIKLDLKNGKWKIKNVLY